ncbi:hypothetical protein NSQ26_07595 [Bacillus sp. FSL W7-1360]
MKRVKQFIASTLVISLLASQGSHVFAEEKVDYTTIAKNMIEMYDASEKVDDSKEDIEEYDDRFVNDMMLKQAEKQETLEEHFAESEKQGEEFYSSDEILESDPEDFDISEKDMDYIKDSVRTQKEDLDNLIEALKSLGEDDHPVTKRLEEEASMEIPESLIYVDHTVNESRDGTISGGGWPNCLDDNGYGYKNFITSDCYKAIIVALLCAADSTIGKMNSKLRYCKHKVRNCSGLIGHKKTWHTHKWYQKIP